MWSKVVKSGKNRQKVVKSGKCGQKVVKCGKCGQKWYEVANVVKSGKKW